MDLVSNLEWLYRQDLRRFTRVNCRFKDKGYVHRSSSGLSHPNPFITSSDPKPYSWILHLACP